MFVQVSTNGADYSLSALPFQCLANRTLAIYPTSGPENGGTWLTVYGVHFIDSGSLACRFGQVYTARATWISSDIVRCVTPPSIPGQVALSLTVNGKDYYDSGIMFEFQETLAIDDVIPQMGPVTGGTTVRVLATNVEFSGNLKCRFGTIEVPATYLNRSEVWCITPPHIEQSVPLQITKNGIDYEVSNMTFNFVPAPLILDVFPEFGWSTGGAVIMLNVSGMSDDGSSMFCSFGDKIVKAVRHGAYGDAIDCAVPAITLHRPLLEVSLGVVFENSPPVVDLFGHTFTYYRPVTVQKAVPPVGPEQGGTIVTVPRKFR